MTARITRKRIFIIIRAGRNQTIQGFRGNSRSVLWSYVTVLIWWRHPPAPYKSTYSRHIYTTKEPVNTVKHFEVSQLIRPEQNWPISLHKTSFVDIDWRKLFTFRYVQFSKHHWATITNNSPSQNYSHPNDHSTPSKSVKQEQFTVANICLSEKKLSVAGFEKNAEHHWWTYKLLIWSQLSGVTCGDVCSIGILEHFSLHHRDTWQCSHPNCS